MKITLTQVRSFIGKISISTKTLIGAVVTGTSLLQIQEARDFVIKHTVAHPRIASICVGILGVLTLLHNPTVQKILHIEQTSSVELPDGKLAVANTVTDAEVK